MRVGRRAEATLGRSARGPYIAKSATICEAHGNRLRLSARPNASPAHTINANLKMKRSRQPSLAANHMPRVGRSSDSRAVAKLAFSRRRTRLWSLKRPGRTRDKVMA